mmetsp:Transcript_2305/g.8912  ORF Transcript_2305/g.8912 Transcript_2305/m.8912 type:complete len:243 (+) Transcript_2305:3038-3766(+)
MYPAVPGPCRVMRRFASSPRGILTAVPQSVNFRKSFTTSPVRPLWTWSTSKFFAFKSRHKILDSFNCSSPTATCSIKSSFTEALKGTPSLSMKSSKLPNSHKSVRTARHPVSVGVFLVEASFFLSSSSSMTTRVALVYPCTFTAMSGRPSTVATSSTAHETRVVSTTRAHTSSPLHTARYAVQNPPSPSRWFHSIITSFGEKNSRSGRFVLIKAIASASLEASMVARVNHVSRRVVFTQCVT